MPLRRREREGLCLGGRGGGRKVERSSLSHETRAFDRRKKRKVGSGAPLLSPPRLFTLSLCFLFLDFPCSPPLCRLAKGGESAGDKRFLFFFFSVAEHLPPSS